VRQAADSQKQHIFEPDITHFMLLTIVLSCKESAGVHVPPLASWRPCFPFFLNSNALLHSYAWLTACLTNGSFTLLPLLNRRLQQYARDARKEYAELGSKDLSELKSFVKGLPKLLLLDRLSDLAVPVAEVVKEQVRLQAVFNQQLIYTKFCDLADCGVSYCVFAWACMHMRIGLPLAAPGLPPVTRALCAPWFGSAEQGMCMPSGRPHLFMFCAGVQQCSINSWMLHCLLHACRSSMTG
jgi:hypothetical protein